MQLMPPGRRMASSAVNRLNNLTSVIKCLLKHAKELVDNPVFALELLKYFVSKNKLMFYQVLYISYRIA